MLKWKNRIFVLGFFVVLLCANSIADASGHVTFRIEVVSGFAVSVPDTLVFAPAAPGETVYQDLPITVWSNVGWELRVSSPGGALDGEGSPSSVSSGLQVCVEGNVWRDLFGLERMVATNQPPTGSEGMQVNVPFRFVSDFSNEPGVYTIDVEFTVVPVI